MDSFIRSLDKFGVRFLVKIFNGFRVAGIHHVPKSISADYNIFITSRISKYFAFKLPNKMPLLVHRPRILKKHQRHPTNEFLHLYIGSCKYTFKNTV